MNGKKRLPVLAGVLGVLVWGAGLRAAAAAWDGPATPVISEFVAANGSQKPLAAGDLLDADGDSSDWIELYNPTAGTFDLGGWYLTDDPDQPDKWQFPSPTVLAPDGYLLVFASGKDRTKGQLHTNFKLSAEGGYLALVMADGRTVAHEYGPSYPPQLTDLSYGLVQSRRQLVTPQSTAAYHVPTAGDEGLAWTAADFDDSDWRPTPANLSLAQPAGAAPGARTTHTVRDDMLNRNTSIWIRIKFDASQVELFDSLLLYLQYEDGFVAYLNGVEVARENFTGTAHWDSASDSDRPDAWMGQPVAFDLSARKDLLRTGANVLAIQGLNDSRANTVFQIAPSLAASSMSKTPQYLAVPTPGGPNMSGAIEIVAGPQFSQPHGLYDAPFTLTLSCATPGAIIAYTTNGKLPPDPTGYLYTGPITIRTTTCIRAVALKGTGRPSAVITSTYIFPADVERQPNRPAGFPATWGTTAADYEMDPEILTAQTRAQLAQALKSLPTISLTMNVDDLFGPQGIYTNSQGRGVQWERAASVEWIDPNGKPGFQVNAGLRLQGGSPFRGFDLTRKKSFRLLFKEQYGPTKLNYPVFEDKGAATSFDTLTLRAGANDGWNNWGRQNTQYIVDEFMRRTQLALGQPSAHGTFVHLYLNGLYWGMYNLLEKPDTAFAATYYGGEKEEWDALNAGTPLTGSTATTWNAMLNMVRQGMDSNANYQKLLGNNPDGTRNPAYDILLDLDNYIDYMYCNFWGGTGDWPGHNFRAACRRPPNSTGYKIFNWDSEGALGIWANPSVTEVRDGVAVPYAALRSNPEFCLLFADHVQRHLFNEGPTTATRALDRYQKLANLVEPAILAESARWGDQASATPYTLTHWRNARDSILKSFIPQRPAALLAMLKSAGLYPTVDAPVFFVNGVTQHGGVVPSNSLLLMMPPAAGMVYYTTDGTDPRLPGYLSKDSKMTTLVAEDAPKKVLVPSVANGGSVLANLTPGFDVTYYKAKGTVSSLAAAEAVIADVSQQAGTTKEKAQVINYFNSGSPGEYGADRPFPGTNNNVDVDNFVVLVTGKITIPQAGNWSFGVSSDDGFGMTLTRGAKTYSVSYPDPRSPGDTVQTFNIAEAGLHDLRLVFYEQGGGSELELFAARGSFTSFSSQSFRLVGDVAQGGLQVGGGNVWYTNAFNDMAWKSGTGGVGYDRGTGYETLFKIDVGTEMYQINGTCYIRIPFVVSNADYSNLLLKIRYDDGFVAYLNGAEVARRNATGDLQWNSLASADNPDASAAGLATIDISNYAGLLGPGLNLLALQGLNGTLDSSDFLISVELAAGEMSQGTVSPAAVPWTAPVALKQSTHFKARSYTGRWSALEDVVFAVGPVAESLRVSELMYHPRDTGNPNDPNTEFLELTNIGTQSINLNLVRFTQGIDCTFPSFDLPAGGYCLVVKDRAAFQAKYGSQLPVAGQYTGSLDNGGERVELVDAIGKVVQSFKYEDNWFKSTDGKGYSLTVRDPKAADPSSLNDQNAWRASTLLDGSPGLGD